MLARHLLLNVTFTAQQSACAALHASPIDIREVQDELDSFFGSEHAPAEAQHPLDAASERTAVTHDAAESSGSVSHRNAAPEAALTHVDEEGGARMVDVGQVCPTASCRHDRASPLPDRA